MLCDLVLLAIRDGVGQPCDARCDRCADGSSDVAYAIRRIREPSSASLPCFSASFSPWRRLFSARALAAAASRFHCLIRCAFACRRGLLTVGDFDKLHPAFLALDRIEDVVTLAFELNRTPLLQSGHVVIGKGNRAELRVGRDKSAKLSSSSSFFLVMR